MVTVLTRSVELDITADEEKNIYGLLRTRGRLTADEVASIMKLDESDVAVYLANEAGLGRIDARYGRYSTWE